MSAIEVGDFSNPDEVRSPDRTTIELVKIGGGEIGRFTFQPGWRWSECIKPVVGTETCQVDHLGYIVSGTLHVDHESGSGDVTAGNVYRIPPGHDAYVVGDEPVVALEFQGAAHYGQA